jgi:uncharacterized membrane protein
MNSDNVEDRLASIEKRLSQIENRFGMVERKPVAPHSPGPWDKAANAPAVPVMEAQPGNWLGIIAVLCFVLAAGFIVKLSIESGWLTHTRQIGLSVLLGLGLIGAGLKLLESDREYASLLPGAGIIILYLSAFAAHRYYDLIPIGTALAWVSVVSVMCIWLYTKIRHDIYPVTAAAGSYLAPIVLSLGVGAEFSLYYFLLCSMGFAAISIWVRSRVLTLVSAYLAILATALVGLDIYQDRLVAVMLALHFVIFSVGAYAYSKYHNTALTEQEAWSFMPVLLAFYAMEYHFIERIQPGLAPWISLAFAGVLMALYLSAKKHFTDNLGSQALVVSFVTLVGFHSVYLELLPDMLRPWLFVAIMLALAFSPLRASASSGPFYIARLAVFAILAIEYVSMLGHLFDHHEAQWLLVSFCAFASMWAVILTQGAVGDRRDSGHMLLAAAHILAVLGLYRLTTDAGSLAVSASWLFYAVGVMVFAFTREDEVMAKSALFVLAFAAGKALLYDAASAPTIVRILCLLLTGAALYGCGFLMRRISGWSVKP